MTELIRIFRPENGRCRLAAVSDNWISLTETVSFRGTGELRLTLAAGSPAAAAAALGDLLLVGGDWFVAEGITRDAKTHTVTLRAPGVLSYLSRAVASVAAPETLPAGEAILSLAAEFAGDVLPLPLETDGGTTGDSIMLTPGPDNLGSLAARLAVAGRCGLSMTVSPGEGKLVFSSPAMRDRTVGSASPVVLGTDMDTLLDTEETVDLGTYRSRVTVTSAEEVNGAPVSVTVEASSCAFGDGWDDACAGLHDAVLTVSVPTGGFYLGTIFDLVSYRAALRARGKDYLAKHRPTVTLSARLPDSTAEKLSPGDLVSVRFGGTVRTRLVTEKTVRRSRGETYCGVVLEDAELETD